ncbi:shikimate kinase [Fervidibacillus albus]|uniref:Shikimate kinase n=1 Tax=Fervidibacillus albus TaxID=2980026 RepID=A0A9E8LTZ3_9BACI|nr:shikimate kinase [Fervidibacillus albus]WAA08769.1 shikimate kinase [Fervidibacillus albus]
MDQQNRPIVLIGFMGVGKTSVGKALAKKLNWQWVDIDQRIEQHYEMEISEIFRLYGEHSFREIERELFLESIQHSSTVISTGGGAFLQKAIQEKSLQNGLVIYLDISWDAWTKRLPFLKDRPLLQRKTEVQMKQLFNTRKAIYANHHLKISTDGCEISEIVRNIIDSLENRKEGNQSV